MFIKGGKESHSTCVIEKVWMLDYFFYSKEEIFETGAANTMSLRETLLCSHGVGKSSKSQPINRIIATFVTKLLFMVIQ